MHEESQTQINEDESLRSTKRRNKYTQEREGKK